MFIKTYAYHDIALRIARSVTKFKHQCWHLYHVMYKFSQLSNVVSGSVPQVKINPCVFLLKSVCRP